MIIVLNKADASANNLGNISIPSPVQDETVALLKRMSRYTRNDEIAIVLNSMIYNLKKNGIWDKLSCLCVPCMAKDATEMWYDAKSGSDVSPVHPASFYLDPKGWGIRHGLYDSSLKSNMVSISCRNYPGFAGLVTKFEDSERNYATSNLACTIQNKLSPGLFFKGNYQLLSNAFDYTNCIRTIPVADLYANVSLMSVNNGTTDNHLNYLKGNIGEYRPAMAIYGKPTIPITQASTTHLILGNMMWSFPYPEASCANALFILGKDSLTAEQFEVLKDGMNAIYEALPQ